MTSTNLATLAAELRIAAEQNLRLRDFRTQVAQLLSIPPNAEDAFVLNELDHLCRRVEECEQDHREARNG